MYGSTSASAGATAIGVSNWSSKKCELENNKNQFFAIEVKLNLSSLGSIGNVNLVVMEGGDREKFPDFSFSLQSKT